MTLSIADRLGQEVRVNAIQPGVTDQTAWRRTTTRRPRRLGPRRR